MTRRYVTQLVTVTQAECDAVAAMARQMEVPAGDKRYDVTSPRCPWGETWPDPIVMAVGRIATFSRQEGAVLEPHASATVTVAAPAPQCAPSEG